MKSCCYNTHKLTTLAVVVLLVFNGCSLMTCEAALIIKPETAKKIVDFFGKIIEKGIEHYEEENRSYPSLPPPNRANIKQVYCPLFRQIAKDTNQSMPTRRAAANTFQKYCTH